MLFATLPCVSSPTNCLYCSLACSGPVSGRCPRTLDMNFPPPGPDLCRAHNKRKSAAHILWTLFPLLVSPPPPTSRECYSRSLVFLDPGSQSNKSTKRLRDQDENNVRPADSTPAAAGRPAKPSKAKAGADTSKRPAKPRAGMWSIFICLAVHSRWPCCCCCHCYCSSLT